MKISVVVPAFNEEKNLPDCLNSIFSEISRSNCSAEVIVVNNASTDSTREVAIKCGAHVVDEKMKGIIWARKSGYEASTGDLIANIDADNRLPEGWLSFVLSTFNKEKDLVALSGPLVYHDLPPMYRAVIKFYYIIGYWFDKIVGIGRTAMLQGGNYVVKKEALEKIGGYDTSINFYGEDTDVGRRMRTVGKVIWTFGLPMYSSGRRIKEEGLVTMGLKYGANYLSIIFRKKPATEEYIDIRR